MVWTKGATGTGSSWNRDHSYSVSFIHGVLTSGVYEWRIQAYDRAGNRTWSDSEGAPGIQKHMLTVDALSPEVAAVYAGIGFDSAEGNEVQDSSSLLIVFENEGEEGENNEPSYPLGMVDPPRPVLHPGRRLQSRGA